MALFGKAAAPESGPKAVLEAVRKQTCYGALRGLVNVILAIVLIACAIAGVAGTIAAVKSFDIYQEAKGANLFVGIGFVAASVFVAFLGFAGRQAAFVVIDIADLLVADRADAAHGTSAQSDLA